MHRMRFGAQSVPAPAPPTAAAPPWGPCAAPQARASGLPSCKMDPSVAHGGSRGRCSQGDERGGQSQAPPHALVRPRNGSIGAWMAAAGGRGEGPSAGRHALRRRSQRGGKGDEWAGACRGQIGPAPLLSTIASTSGRFGSRSDAPQAPHASWLPCASRALGPPSGRAPAPGSQCTCKARGVCAGGTGAWGAPHVQTRCPATAARSPPSPRPPACSAHPPSRAPRPAARPSVCAAAGGAMAARRHPRQRRQLRSLALVLCLLALSRGASAQGEHAQAQLGGEVLVAPGLVPVATCAARARVHAWGTGRGRALIAPPLLPAASACRHL